MDKSSCNEYEKIMGTFMFTDVKASSMMTKEFGNEEMTKALCEHYYRMYRDVNDFGGVVIKTVGDEFVVFFENSAKNCYDGSSGMLNALKCAIKIQTDMLNIPIMLTKNGYMKRLRIRIGLGCGTAKKIKMISQKIVGKPKVSKLRKYMKSKNVTIDALKPISGTDKYIQSFYLDDYLGNIVNLASRMESVMANPDGIAFCMDGIESVNQIPDTEYKQFIYEIENYIESLGFVGKDNVKFIELDKSSCEILPEPAFYQKLFGILFEQSFDSKKIVNSEKCIDRLRAGAEKMVVFKIDFKRFE